MSKLQQDSSAIQSVQETNSGTKPAIATNANLDNQTTGTPATSTLYKSPTLDGSGKYNDGNVSFNYASSTAIKIGTQTGGVYRLGGKSGSWEYQNTSRYVSLFSGDYTVVSNNDPKTDGITAGAEIRILLSTSYPGDFAGTTPQEARQKESLGKGSTVTEIATSDGSSAFEVTNPSNANGYTNDIGLFDAFFIKGTTEYEIMYNGAASDIPKYKSQFDTVVSSFRFLR